MAAGAAVMMPMLRGLYVVTKDRRLGSSRLTTTVEAALRGGARMVQYLSLIHI